MLKQRGTDALPLLAGQNVGVADKIDVAHRLEAHHADQCAVLLVTPEYHAGRRVPRRAQQTACRARAIDRQGSRRDRPGPRH
jgi:hypothetical protein